MGNARTALHDRFGGGWRRALAVLAISAPMACDTAADPTSNRPSPDDELRARLALSTLGAVPHPPDNPLVPERVALGHTLFFDPILSGEEDVACATCHLAERAFTDHRQFASGVGGGGLGPERSVGVSRLSGDPMPQTRRNTTTVFNTGMAEGPGGGADPDAPLFWDGRARGLEDQALQPLLVREEMRGDALPGPDETVLDSLARRLRRLPGYVERFSAAFPDEAASGFDPDVVTPDRIARALAAYQRELVTRASPYDRWVEGDDDAMTAQQKKGMELFFTRARCFVCHDDPLFGSFGFFVTGVPQAGRGGAIVPGDDLGREEHTGDPSDRYAFRVPSLRNVELTPPYMHSGVFETLDEVVRFYARGNRPRHPAVPDDGLSAVLREPPLLNPEEEAALVAFLRALTDPGTGIDPALLEAPEVVPSGLSYTGESADFVAMAGIVAGGDHACAISGRASGVPNGTVYCWGRNDRGQLGVGTAGTGDHRILPARVSAPAPGGLDGGAEEVPFGALGAGRDFTCGRSLAQELFCWGGGPVGGGHLRPARVGNGRHWHTVDGGGTHACALDSANGLFCWGGNEDGQLGSGAGAALEPRPVGGGPWAAVSAGGRHTCALDEGGAAWCWGANEAGQLGTRADADGAPRPVAVASDRTFREISAGEDHTCAVDDEGTMWCWGSNARGKLGAPVVLASSPVPRRVEAEVHFRAVAAGLGHTCAASTALEAWCWGDNRRGQLGLDAAVPEWQADPAAVRTGRAFAALSAGGHHTCAIEAARGWCWGDGAFGQVGNGSTAPNLVPGVVIGRP